MAMRCRFGRAGVCFDLEAGGGYYVWATAGSLLEFGDLSPARAEPLSWCDRCRMVSMADVRELVSATDFAE
eukprot:11200737-Lingulodinium_polyedra.AAC.1